MTTNFIDHPSMTTLEIAGVAGKPHRQVLANARALLWHLGIPASEVTETYRDRRNAERPCYRLGRRETLVLLSGYNPRMRTKIIERCLELERLERDREAARDAPACERTALREHHETIRDLEHR
jgi:phage regulator Rha-like protein